MKRIIFKSGKSVKVSNEDGQIVMKEFSKIEGSNQNYFLHILLNNEENTVINIMEIAYIK